MATTYSLGCTDCHGNPCNDHIPVGERKNRHFDPSNDPRYSTTVNLPSELTVYNLGLQITHLCLGDGYQPTSADRVFTQGGRNIQPDTIVVEVGGKKRGQSIIGARFFGMGSEYNRNSLPTPNTTIDKATSDTICIGCQTVEKIAETRSWIKKAVFMTSSKAIYDGVQNVWSWFESGFPDLFSSGLAKQDFLFLHTNIKHLEDRGIEVLFWLVKPENIVGSSFLADNEFDERAHIPVDKNNCKCWKCIIGEQHRELTFARTGREPCPCERCRVLIVKYGNLKKGDSFPMTNNAGVKDAMVIMEVDGEGRAIIDALAAAKIGEPLLGEPEKVLEAKQT